MTRRLASTLGLVLAAAIALVGCGGSDGASDEATTELTPAELGEVGGRIYVEPDRAEALLAELELTREEFEARVREVSSHPDRAREYTEAFDAVVAGSGTGPDEGAEGTASAAPPG